MAAKSIVQQINLTKLAGLANGLSQANGAVAKLAQTMEDLKKKKAASKAMVEKTRINWDYYRTRMKPSLINSLQKRFEGLKFGTNFETLKNKNPAVLSAYNKFRENMILNIAKNMAILENANKIIADARIEFKRTSTTTPMHELTVEEVLDQYPELAAEIEEDRKHFIWDPTHKGPPDVEEKEGHSHH